MTDRCAQNAASTLKDCRRVTLLMRQQEASLLNLMDVKASLQVEKQSLARQIDGLTAILEGTREQYKRAVVAAVCELSVLSGRDYDILCMFYVIGLSLNEIAVRLHVNVRSVSRGKARGLALLEHSRSSCV